MKVFSEIGLKITNRTKDILVGVLLGIVIMGFALLTLLFFKLKFRSCKHTIKTEKFTLKMI